MATNDLVQHVGADCWFESVTGAHKPRVPMSSMGYGVA